MKSSHKSKKALKVIIKNSHSKKKTGIAALYGALKGKIHYESDAIFNLDW